MTRSIYLTLGTQIVFFFCPVLFTVIQSRRTYEKVRLVLARRELKNRACASNVWAKLKKKKREKKRKVKEKTESRYRTRMRKDEISSGIAAEKPFCFSGGNKDSEKKKKRRRKSRRKRNDCTTGGISPTYENDQQKSRCSFRFHHTLLSVTLNRRWSLA